MYTVGHFEFAPESGLVLFRMAPRDCCVDAVSSFTKYHEVVQDTWLNFIPWNSPAMQFDKRAKFKVSLLSFLCFLCAKISAAFMSSDSDVVRRWWYGHTALHCDMYQPEYNDLADLHVWI